MGKLAKGKQLIHLLLDEPFLKRLDAFRTKYRLDSRSEAIRWLMKAALDKGLAPKPGVMSEPRLHVFLGGGRVTIREPGKPNRPTRFEVEWQNPSAERLRETQAFWESVHGHVAPWTFDYAGTTYEPCYFEADSLTYEVTPARGTRLAVRFRAMMAPQRRKRPSVPHDSSTGSEPASSPAKEEE